MDSPPQDTAPARDPSQDTATRSEVLNQAQRMLVALNAGGVLALLTLVQAVWENWPAESLDLVLDGVFWLLLGAILVPLVGVVRYVNGLLRISFKPFRNPVWYAIMLLYIASGFCFVYGSYHAVDGGYRALEVQQADLPVPTQQQSQ